MEQELARQPEVATDRRLSLVEVRGIVKDLFDHRPLVYWSDLLISAAVAWGALALAVSRPGFDAVRITSIPVGSFAFLRAVLFIHELSHFRRGVLSGFTPVWNLLVGVPMLLPSFMYVGTHTDHHKRTLYGTIKDPEYLPLARMSRWRVALFVLEMPLVPLLLVLRFGLLSPLSWLIRPLRAPVVERLSALVINPGYRRAAPKGRARINWIALEVLILAWVVLVAVLIARGTLTLDALLCWYLVAAGVALVNQVRTLAAHHYRNEGDELSTVDQLLDSINVRGVPVFTELVFPVGLRYHALHHYLADMPYHGLAAAHRRLMAELPEDSVYRETEKPGLVGVIRDLWAASGRVSRSGLPEKWKAGGNS